MMKDAASVTMIAGKRPSRDEPADDRADAGAERQRRRAKPPKTPSGPCIVVAATTEPRLTVAPMERSMPPVSMTMACASATTAIGNQFWTNLFADAGG